MPSYKLSIRSRAGAIALGMAVVVIGFVVLISGIALLIGVALLAVLLAGGAILLRKIFGSRTPPAVRRTSAPGFDPALEVFPDLTEEPPRLADPVRPVGDERDGRTRAQRADGPG